MDKYKKLAANTVIFAIGSFGAKILAFFLSRLYTTHFESSLLGTKELIETTANFLIPIVSFSIGDAIIRYGLNRKYDKTKIFSTAVFTVLMGLTGLALLSPLFNLIPYLDGYGFLLYVYIYCSCFRAVCSNFARAKGLVRLFAADGIFATLTLFIFNILFISVLNLGLKGFLISVILSDFTSGLFLTFMGNMWKNLSFKAIDKTIFHKMFKFALPLVPTALMWIITGFSDRLFLRYMNGPEGLVGESATGIYTAASKIPNLIAMVSTIFFQAWNMSAIMERESKDLSAFYSKVYSAYQSVLFIASAWLIALVMPLSKILLNYNVFPEYATAYKYTPILVTGVLMMCFSQFLSSVYNVTKRTKNSFVTSAVAAGVNIVLNIILISKMGIQGASIATFLSYAVCYITRIIDVKRYIPFKTDHIKGFLNMAVLWGMCGIIIFLPSGWVSYLIAGTAYITIANFGAVIRTVKQVLKRRA